MGGFNCLLIATAILGAWNLTLAQTQIPTEFIEGSSEELNEIVQKLATGESGGAEARLRELGESGEVQALLVLGICYEKGIGVAGSGPNAIDVWQEADQLGSPQAARLMGNLYRSGGFGIRPDPNQARKWFSKADNGGDLEAKVRLGQMELRGEGIAAPDPEKAQFLFSQAAEAGSSLAMIELGRLLKSPGTGRKPDYVQAKEWFEKAEQNNGAAGSFELGLLYQHGLGVSVDDERAEFYFRKAAEKRVAEAMVHLGNRALAGIGHEGKADTAAAVDWFRKAADEGSLQGMFLVGLHLSKSTDPKLSAQAGDFLKDSAEGGYPPAQNELAKRFLMGGEARDVGQALRWFNAAATLGYAPAMTNLGRAYENGLAPIVQPNLKAAVRWYSEAAKRRDVVAQYALANLYHLGRGVTKDLLAAYVLSSDAGNRGLKRASELAKKIHPMLTPAQLDEAAKRLASLK